MARPGQRIATSPCLACLSFICLTSPIRSTPAAGKAVCCSPSSARLRPREPSLATQSTWSSTAAWTPRLVLNTFPNEAGRPAAIFAIAVAEKIFSMPVSPHCSTGDWRLIISTRADRTSSSAAAATLTWMSTPAPWPPASISARLSIARRLPNPFRSPLPLKSPLRRSLLTMTRDAQPAFASTAIRILKASPRWATPTTHRRSASCTCPASISTRLTARSRERRCAGTWMVPLPD